MSALKCALAYLSLSLFPRWPAQVTLNEFARMCFCWEGKEVQDGLQASLVYEMQHQATTITDARFFSSVTAVSMCPPCAFASLSLFLFPGSPGWPAQVTFNEFPRM